MTDSSRLEIIVRRATGALFILTGAFKLFVPFGAALSQLGVPLAPLAGIAVPLLEVFGGLALWMNRGVRVAAPLLACNMMAAIALVGWRGAQGQTLQIGTHSIGGEAWRLPLEIVLLVALLWLSGTKYFGHGAREKS